MASDVIHKEDGLKQKIEEAKGKENMSKNQGTTF